MNGTERGTRAREIVAELLRRFRVDAAGEPAPVPRRGAWGQLRLGRREVALGVLDGELQGGVGDELELEHELPLLPVLPELRRARRRLPARRERPLTRAGQARTHAVHIEPRLIEQRCGRRRHDPTQGRRDDVDAGPPVSTDPAQGRARGSAPGRPAVAGRGCRAPAGRDRSRT